MHTATDQRPTEQPGSEWSTFAVVAGAMVVGSLNYSIVFVAFPELQRAFNQSASAVSWSVTAFSITVAALTMPCGWLADRLGRRRQFLLGVTLFAVGSALVALSPSLAWLIVARIVQAAGLAVEAPAAQAIVLSAFPAERRSTAVGAIGALGGLSAAIGPVVGGALIDAVGWRWTFAASVPISVFTLVTAWRRLARDSPVADGEGRPLPDLVGTALLIVGISLLALGIVQADDWGWTSINTLGALFGAVALVAMLIWRCAHHPDPIVDLGLWRNRNFRIGTILGLVIAGHFGSVFLTSMVLLTEVWGLSRFGSGLAVALIPAIAGPLTLFAGRWADRHGHSKVIVPGSVIFVAAGLFFVVTVSAERRMLAVWVPGVVLYATAVGLSHAACQSAALSEIAADRLGRAGSTARIFTDLGNTIWVAIAVAIVAGAPDTVTGVRRVFATMMLVGIVGVLMGLRLRLRAAPEQRSAARQ